MGDTHLARKMDQFFIEQRNTQHRIAHLLHMLTQIVTSVFNNNNNQGGSQGQSTNEISSRKTTTKSSRPMIPTFAPRVEQQEENELALVYLQDQLRQDWIDGGLQIEISLKDYMNLRMRHIPKRGNHANYSELETKVGKINIPYFDGP